MPSFGTAMSGSMQENQGFKTLHDFCPIGMVMGNYNSAIPDAERLLELLEDILLSYKGGNSRPERSLLLYRQCLRLSMNYRVRLAKHFVVIEGGARRKRSSSPLRAMPWRRKASLRLAAKSESGAVLP